VLTPLFCALLLRVEVLGLLHLREASITAPEGAIHALAEGDAVRFAGARKAGPAPLLRLEPGADAAAQPLTVRVRGLPAPRAFPGALEVSARGGVLHFVSEVPLEEYVAGVVEAELGPGAPRAALEALAVVVRSFAVSRTEAAAQGPAAAHLHAAGAPLCDQTHCQVYKGKARLPAALEAARSTEGEVLVLASGAVAPALHHAACGGRTAAAREIWPAASAEDEEAGAPVDDTVADAVAETAAGAGPGSHAPAACEARPGEPPLAWEVAVDTPRLAKALGASPPLSLTAEAGPDGLLRRLHVAGLGILTAEQVHLRLGRALGWGRVRSPRFTWATAGTGSDGAPVFKLLGRGHGHGVGLCQRGALFRATRGADRHQLLARYFPLLRARPLPRGPRSQ
jgi:stage II sporulation protein D